MRERKMEVEEGKESKFGKEGGGKSLGRHMKGWRKRIFKLPLYMKIELILFLQIILFKIIKIYSIIFLDIHAIIAYILLNFNSPN